jgi:tryptophanyl-tRNA synthetase
MNLCIRCNAAPANHALCVDCKAELKAQATAEVQPIQQARDAARQESAERSRKSWALLTGKNF